MKKAHRAAALFTALCLALGLAACGSDRGAGTAVPSPSASPSASPSPSPSPTQTAQRSPGEVSVALFSQPQALDPALVDGPDSIALCSHLFEGLMRWEDSGREAPGGQHMAQLAAGQAERYEKTVAEDGKVTYTFTLREDAKWSDGEPVTAQDFVTSWRRLANSQGSSAYSYLLGDVVNATQIAAGAASYDQLGVSAPDERTFVVELEQESLDFLEVCAHPATAPLRLDVLQKEATQWSTNPRQWVSNGPYILDDWTSNGTIKLIPNRHYSPELDGPSAILFQSVSSDEAALSALQAGSIDFSRRAPAAPEDKEALVQSGVLRNTDYAGVYYLTYQTGSAPFDDPQVRRAFTLALDRAALAALDPAGGSPAGGLVPNGVYSSNEPPEEDFRTQAGDYYSTDPEALEENRAQARTLLAQAGYPQGKDFPKVTYLYNKGEVHQAVAQAMKEMWEEALGVQVELQEETWDNYLHLISHGEFTIAKAAWTADRNDPADFLSLCDPSAAQGWYKNDDLGQLLTRAGQTDGDARNRLLLQAENLLLGRDWAVCPLYFYTSRYLISSALEGVYLTPTGNYYFTTAVRK